MRRTSRCVGAEDATVFATELGGAFVSDHAGCAARIHILAGTGAGSASGHVEPRRALRVAALSSSACGQIWARDIPGTATEVDDGLLWYWIGTHADYDNMIRG